jgi:predicted metal-dependent enzyme (double-stranded beta helix superfamily)
MSSRLADYVAGLTRLVTHEPGAEDAVLNEVCQLTRQLVAVDDWLPREFAQPHEQFYRQYLLYGDPLQRFSVVSFVWGPGQRTPIHDHTVWGVIGMLRGAECSQHYELQGEALAALHPEQRLERGEVAVVSPARGDIHAVRNAFDDSVSISIHAYGGNIGTLERSVFKPGPHGRRRFVSGYSNPTAPNLWWRA